MKKKQKKTDFFLASLSTFPIMKVNESVRPLFISLVDEDDEKKPISFNSSALDFSISRRIFQWRGDSRACPSAQFFRTGVDR